MKQLFFESQRVHRFADNLQRAREQFRLQFWAAANQWLRDATIADMFAQKSSAHLVNLVATERPDFEVTYRNGLNLQCEATYADLPNRRIGKELKEWTRSGQQIREDPFEHWKLRRDAIPNALDRAASEKAGKGYDPSTSLVIYLNLGTYDVWRDEIERELIQFTGAAHGKFRSVWVLWGGRLYRCWPQPFLGSAHASRARVIGVGKALLQYEQKRLLRELFD